jgi:hypothetical protein
MEMDLQELARHEGQRLAVGALERKVAHGGRQHVAFDETELEMVGHGCPDNGACWNSAYFWHGQTRRASPL